MTTGIPPCNCPAPGAISPRPFSSVPVSPTTYSSGPVSPRTYSSKPVTPRPLPHKPSSPRAAAPRGSLPRPTIDAADEFTSNISELDRAADETDIKQPEHASPATRLDILKLAYQSLGVIYGDMGTSPLYVFSSTFDSPPESDHDVVGVLSLIFWTITVVALVKYVCIVLSADDNGEGGTAALYTLLCRHVKISLLISQHKSDTRLTNYKRIQNQPNTMESQIVAKCKAYLEGSPRIHKVLLVVVMAGSCMVIGDGILTPAISVLSAIEGIQVVAVSLKTTVVLVITCAILIALFLLQRYGTDKVSGLFAPVVLLWLTLIAAIGVYNIAVHRPSVFGAISPHHGILFLVRMKRKGWIMLGGVVLSITGTEAMFADLGHFSQRSIQIAFGGVVYPCLVLAYFGQAAYLTVHPEDVERAFFKSIPAPIFWPMLVVATLATIVASQAMISGAFSVINQSVNLGCFPRVKVVHTSKTVRGQIFIPEINYALMVLCIAVVLGFQKTAAIGNAYGIAVVSVMFITTCLTSLVVVLVWQYHLLLGILFLSMFGLFEGLYLSAVLYKVAFGGWVPLVIAGAILSVMCVWKYGTLAKHRFDLKHMVRMDQLDELIADSRITRVPGIGFFYTNSDVGIPPTFSNFIKNLPALHQIMVFVCIKYVPVTSVLAEERVYLRHLTVKNFYQSVIRYGYHETPMAGQDFEDLVVNKIAEQIKSEKFWHAAMSSMASRSTSPKHSRQSTLSGTELPDFYAPSDSPRSRHSASPRPVTRTFIQVSSLHPPVITAVSQAEVIEEELAYLFDAKEKGVVYVIGSTEVQAKAGSSWYKHFLIDIAYCVLCKCCRSDVIMLNIPTQRLIEVGMIYDL